ncbi:MAG: Gfo/Idh/MocA family oxidoreductase [Treponema sp.]|nr:Gfo/Idh/MocA family oxidoreductase [Treponema sp.]
MVPIALLSAWHVHTYQFIDRLHESGAGKLSVVWDEDGERGKKCAEKYGVPFEPSLDAVLGRPGIEAVMVEAPTVRHGEIIAKAAAAGKHIFSDKALAPGSAECEKIKRALEEAGVKFVLSMEAKTAAPYRYAKKLIDEGRLGRVTSAYFRRDHGAALERFLPDYWYDTRQTGGGVTMDLGCHGFYLLNQFCGKPKKITSVMNELYGTGGDENSTTLIEFENGAIGTAHTSFVSWKMDNLLEIIGTEGMLVAAGTNAANYRLLLQSKHLPAYQDLSPVPAAEYGKDDVLPIVTFARLVQSGEQKDDRYDIDRAITLTRIIEAAYESARTGRTVAY